MKIGTKGIKRRGTEGLLSGQIKSIIAITKIVKRIKQCAQFTQN